MKIQKYFGYFMILSMTAACWPGGSTAFAARPGDVIISEIMQNPSQVDDSAGEWLELHNTTGNDIDVDGWVLRDNGVDNHTIANGGSLVVPARGQLVLARNGNFGINGGVTVHYTYSGFILANTDDEIILLDEALVEIDRVEYDGGATFPNPNGASMALRDPAFDNGLGANWCISSTIYGAGDAGTPGAPNDCPTPPIINEIDVDTPGTDALEFVELFDGGKGNTPLDGLVLVFFNGAGDSSYESFDLDGYFTNSGGYFLVGNNSVTPVPDIIFGNNGLQNGADAIALYYGNASYFPSGTAVTTTNLIDAIVYDTNDADDPGLLVLLNPGQPQVDESGAGVPDANSNQRCPNGAGGARNTLAYNQAAPTPAAPNQCPARLVVNELDYDQPGVDTAEFIEIKNIDGADVNLSLYSLELINAATSSAYAAIDLPDFHLAAGDYFVLCGNSAEVAECDLEVAPASNLIQNGAPDAVALFFGSVLVDTVSYEGNTAAPFTESSGLGLEDDPDQFFSGVSRYPDGVDTGVNNLDWSPRCITPGEANATSDSYCGPQPDFDIQPGTCPNTLGPLYHASGAPPILYVSLLATPEFDILQVDPDTLRLERADGMGVGVSPSVSPIVIDNATPVAIDSCQCHSLAADGFLDLQLEFRSGDILVPLDLLGGGPIVELRVTGALLSGQTFASEGDCLTMIRPRLWGR